MLVLVLIGTLVGIVASLFALDAMVASTNRGAVLAQSATTGAELKDCAIDYPKWVDDWVKAELADIQREFAPDETAVAVPWSTPEQFPAGVFGWAAAVPECGNVLLVGSTGDLWTGRFAVDSVDKAQFTAISTSLSALGYVLTYDEVPHEFLSVAGEQNADPVSAEEQSDGQNAGVFWYREFGSATGIVTLTFFPDDPEAANPSGELIVSYFPP